MPLNADINQVLMLLGLRTLELEQLRAQCETVAAEFNALREENQALRTRLEVHEPPNRELQAALREVK